MNLAEVEAFQAERQNEATLGPRIVEPPDAFEDELERHWQTLCDWATD
jgi:hypothetical protein